MKTTICPVCKIGTERMIVSASCSVAVSMEYGYDKNGESFAKRGDIQSFPEIVKCSKCQTEYINKGEIKCLKRKKNQQ